MKQDAGMIVVVDHPTGLEADNNVEEVESRDGMYLLPLNTKPHASSGWF